MYEEQYKSIIHRELDIVENFLQEATEDAVKKAALHIFDRLQLGIAKLKDTKEEYLAPRFIAMLNNIKPHIWLWQKKSKDHDHAITQNSFLDEKICKAKIIHFHINDKFANPTINLINGYFNKDEHLHLVSRVLDDAYTAQGFPAGSNVAELDHAMLCPKSLAGKKLIFHSFFSNENVRLLYAYPCLLAHSYWMIWGADFYNAPKTRAATFVRKNVYAIGTFSDAGLARQKYGDNHKFFNAALAVSPVGKKEICAAMRRAPKADGVTIQINNSADESTLDMLDILSRFKGKNIKIKTVLSYGDMKFAQVIIAKGKKIFGENFSYLEKMISPVDYAEYIVGNDILILCQNRQRGSANCCLSLLACKKVFIRQDVTTSAWLRDRGIVIYDSDAIRAMNFSEFTTLDPAIAKKNRDMVDKHVYDEQFRAVNEFQPVFDDECF